MWTLLALIPLFWLWVHGRSQRKKLAQWQKLNEFVRVSEDGTSSLEIILSDMRMQWSYHPKDFIHPSEFRDLYYHVRRNRDGTWECLLAAPSRQAEIEGLEEVLAKPAEDQFPWDNDAARRLGELRKRGWEPLSAEDATAVEAQFQKLVAISRPGWKPRTWG